MDINTRRLLGEVNGGKVKDVMRDVKILRSIFIKVRSIFWYCGYGRIYLRGFLLFKFNWNVGLRYKMYLENSKREIKGNSGFMLGLDKVLRSDLAKCRYLYDKWGGDVDGNKYRFLGKYLRDGVIEDSEGEGYDIFEGIKIVKDL